ncbi:MAG: Cation efflux protein [Rhodocyclaceae bacterium]|nr:Cation efflux protein [Rhodocyclaceae bacterium]
MGHNPSSLPSSPAPAGGERLAEAQRATWASVVVNLVMTVAQVAVGWLAHSQSLVAHGLHSFSDLLSDFLVLYASRQGAHPADEQHPYGHARVETAATLILGVSLSVIGAGILWESGLRLQHVESLQAVQWSAFWVAVATVVLKEGLYRYLIRVAERLRSQLLAANALHTRADAASALVVVVGIGGALLGWRFLDLLAAALMGFMILRMGVVLAWGALQELIDTGLDQAQVHAIQETLAGTPGVLGLHGLRTRRMAHQALVDAHVLVDPRISVSEGHRIAEAARDRVLKTHPEVLDVLVHIDPEEDQVESRLAAVHMPPREALLAHLEPFLQDLPRPERVVFHYLGGQVEAEVFVGREFFRDHGTVQSAVGNLAERLQGDPYISAISLNCQIAPK